MQRGLTVLAMDCVLAGSEWHHGRPLNSIVSWPSIPVARKPITTKRQADVLVKSRRRCCICYGLDRDTSIKQGQIAHLDHDASNDAEENLAFLCLNHHDQYDGKTRQSKSLTQEEVFRYRAELHDAISKAFALEVPFGQARVNPVIGHYIRTGEVESADLTVKLLEDGSYHVQGLALWGTNREYGPNMGDLDFVATLRGDTIEYVSEFNSERPYRAVLQFRDGGLVVTEENWVGMFGLNVMFSGEYGKAS